MKKLIEFYPCPRCGQNIFEIWTTAGEAETTEEPYFKLGANIKAIIRSEIFEENFFLCSQCPQIVFSGKLSYDSREDFFIQKINDFIQSHPEQIDEKFKKIWIRFLRQRLKSRLEEINF